MGHEPRVAGVLRRPRSRAEVAVSVTITQDAAPSRCRTTSRRRNPTLKRGADAKERLIFTDFATAARTWASGLAPPALVGVGTPQYMAPEQWLGVPCSAQTDLWALGVLAFELLTGTWPFLGDSAFDIGIEGCG